MSKESIDQFLNAAGKVPLLTPSEELHLARNVQAMMRLREVNPDGPYSKAEQAVIRRGKRATDRFITANIRLVAYVAGKFARRISSMLDMTLEDLIQEGALGLMRAVERFDPERGYKFSTYAYWWIRQSISRAINHQGRAIRLPIHIAEKLSGLNRRRTELAAKLGRAPSMQELAAAMNMDRQALEHVLMVSSRQASLDVSPLDDGGTLGDIISDGRGADDHLDDVEHSSTSARMLEMMTYLSDREREAITLRYGLGAEPALTLRELGQRQGCSGEAVRVVVDRGLRKLRRLMAERPMEIVKPAQEESVIIPWVLGSERAA